MPAPRTLCKAACVLAVVLYVSWFPGFMLSGSVVVDAPTRVGPRESDSASNAQASSTAAALRPAYPPLCAQPLGYMPVSARPSAVALASYPGSGNTWIRHVIQQGTRVYTGSMYKDNSLLEQFPAETVRDGSVAVVKTHFPCRTCWKRRSGGQWVPPANTGQLQRRRGSVYILRSPFDAILAEFNRKMAVAEPTAPEATSGAATSGAASGTGAGTGSSTSTSHTGVVDEAAFRTDLWTTFVQTRTQSWLENAEFYLHRRAPSAPGSEASEASDSDALGKAARHWVDAQGRETTLVFFERFVAHFESELGVLLAALRTWHGADAIPPTEQALACIAKKKDGSFKRTPKKRFNPFSPEQREAVCAAVQGVWQPSVWGPCNGMLQFERHR